MYSRLKTSLLNHFQKSPPNHLSKDDKKRLRHSLAECQLTDETSRDEPPMGRLLLITDHCSAHIDEPHEDEEGDDEEEGEDDELYRAGIIGNNRSRSIGKQQQQQQQQQPHDSTLFSELSFDSTMSCMRKTSQVENIMPQFALSWNVQYLGSFPISTLAADGIAQRLDRFRPQTMTQNVELSVSLLGVRVNCEKTMIMSHSLRRVCTVVGNPHLNQIAYIALEPAGRTYRRLCHVFRADDTKQIEEIEQVLGQAFDAQTLTNNIISSTKRNNKSNSDEKKEKVDSSKMNEKRSASTIFLNKFLSKKLTSDSPTTPIGSISCKRKRRPVSAVFSSAIHRLSNSTTSMNPKRMTTIETNRQTDVQRLGARLASPVHEDERSSSKASTSSSDSDGSENRHQVQQQKPTYKPPELVYEEKLGEWIYPVDEAITAQLDNCNYFVGLPTRELLVRNLMSQPEGAFVIRYSESKQKCLALSMRVPTSHNPSGISHYLIVRNADGFRLKLNAARKSFASLQMLLTHYSVLPGSLPCTLYFVQWNKNDWKSSIAVTPATRCSNNRHSTVLSKIDENSQPSLGLLTPRRCGASALETPKRATGSSSAARMLRRSQFFEMLDERRVVS